MIQSYTVLTVYLLLANQKFLSCLSLSVQKISSSSRSICWHRFSVELLNPRRKKIKNI